MTFVPENPRSELVMPTNGSGDGVCDTMRMFQIAEPASCSPAFSPTRGSGEGSTTRGAEISGAGIEARPTDVELEDVLLAHPPAAMSRGRTISDVRLTAAMGQSGEEA